MARKKPICRGCGKIAYPSQEAAVKVVAESRGKAGARVYVCTNGGNCYHITSQRRLAPRYIVGDESEELTEIESELIDAARQLAKAYRLPRGHPDRVALIEERQRTANKALAEVMKAQGRGR